MSGAARALLRALQLWLVSGEYQRPGSGQIRGRGTQISVVRVTGHEIGSGV